MALVVWSLVALRSGRELTASALFCLAVAFKQMALYFSPAFFFYLLGRSWQQTRSPLCVFAFTAGVAKFVLSALLLAQRAAR